MVYLPNTASALKNKAKNTHFVIYFQNINKLLFSLTVKIINKIFWTSLKFYFCFVFVLQLGSIADRTISEVDDDKDNCISFQEFVKVGLFALFITGLMVYGYFHAVTI